MEAWERLVRITRPRGGERAGEVVLLGDQVERSVAHAAWLDQQHLGGVGKHVGEQAIVLDEPRQPTLHAVEVDALGKALPLFATPRFRRDEPRGALADIVGGHQLAGGEDDHLVEVVDRALIVDAESGEAVDLVTPQVDTDRGIGGRGEHIDDRAAPGELAAVLDEFLSPVAELDELSPQRLGVDLGSGTNDDRLDLGRSRTEFLQQRTHTGDDHRRAALGIAQAPEDVETLPHRLDAGADALERQRFPAGEVHDLAERQELGEVVGELSRHRAGRAADHEWSPRRQRGERSDRDRPRHLDHGEPRPGIAERPRQPRLVTQQRRQLTQRRVIAAPLQSAATPLPAL